MRTGFTNEATVVAPTGVVGFDLLPDANLDPGARIGATVVRIHIKLNLMFQSSVSDANPVQAWFWAGVMVLPADTPNFTFPNVRGNPRLDWMLWDAISPYRDSRLLTAGSTPSMLWRDYDIKSQRKLVEQDDKPFLVIAAGHLAGDDITEVAGYASVLIKRE